MSKRNSDLEGNEGPSFKKQQLEPNFDDLTSHLEGNECPSANVSELESVVHDVTSSNQEGNEDSSVLTSKLGSDVEDVSELEGNEGSSALNAQLDSDVNDLTSHNDLSNQFSNNELSEQTEHDNFSDISETLPNKNTLALLRQEIYDLERQRLLHSSSINSINFINHYWNRFDKDWCLMLHKLAGDSQETFSCLDISSSTTYSSYQMISELHPDNLEEQLASRVEKTKNVIMDVIGAFNKHKERKEKLELALERLSREDMEDDNTAQDVWNTLICENENLQHLTATLQKYYHESTPMADKLMKAYEPQYCELRRLQCKYERFFQQNKYLHEKNYQLEIDLATLRFDLNNMLLDEPEAQARPDLDEDIMFIDDDAPQIQDILQPDVPDGDVSQNGENVEQIFIPQEQDPIEAIGLQNCERLESISLPLNEPEYPTDAADELNKLAISSLSDMECSIDDKIQDMDFLEPSTSKF
ncbi:uncharacterized protein LOC126836727 [Adelges cooleyi]|uniref:uncharacterized protein LOC126836727 n=1 Tax=Adelges cooleyi TaxID=133065 RepID=UPI002180646D|nr:uncharacterized protein LOC126836727 [Adelges cooleyi]